MTCIIYLMVLPVPRVISAPVHPPKEKARPPGRDRMIATAAAMIGRRGVGGTSFAEVLAESKAPRGSIYYYFPEGKRELVQEAVAWVTALVVAYQRQCLARTPTEVIDHFVGFFQRSLAVSECRNGCPVAAVAIGSYFEEPSLQHLVRESFRSWEAILGQQLRRAGVERSRSRSLATFTVAAVEGALVLCRSEGRSAPLDSVGQLLRDVVGSAPGAVAPPPPSRRPPRAPTSG